jgi:hypothetical protein
MLLRRCLTYLRYLLNLNPAKENLASLLLWVLLLQSNLLLLWVWVSFVKIGSVEQVQFWRAFLNPIGKYFSPTTWFGNCMVHRQWECSTPMADVFFFFSYIYLMQLSLWLMLLHYISWWKRGLGDFFFNCWEARGWVSSLDSGCCK